MMISDTVILKGTSLGRMRHVTVLFVFSSKFTRVKMKGPNKLTHTQTQTQYYSFKLLSSRFWVSMGATLG